ncbi:MAG: carbonic anhydrase [Bdellovibrio sp. ArHS]|uniref:carbonic anhydrase n=1 Tax=Bdellovibrio sp. ArHS TaxID=1569284 RepID=UPI0005835520|nr:carbonic anhydrase [Bdellovibrio sp. ArHS]KHD90031.1 MAG: carbonic anhydrase [Bdellovibrio sp. ArHS]
MLKAFTIGVILLTMTACSSLLRRSPQQETKVVLKDQQGGQKEAPAEATSNDAKEITKVSPNDQEMDEAQAQAAEMKNAVAAAAQHISANHGKEPMTRTLGPVPAEKSLGWLKNGNTRFVKGKFRADGASAKDRQRLLGGQKPHAVIVTCSDSRVPPEVIFDQKLGEIFVIRTVELAASSDVLASAEYAVGELGSNLVVVLGHEACGTGRTSSGLQTVTQELAERSALLRDGIASGEVKIVQAIYHLDSGIVDWR